MLKCRRPSDYNAGMFPAPQKVIRLNVAKLGIISTQVGAGAMWTRPCGWVTGLYWLCQVPDSAHKVFCGGLPYDLGEAEVKELLQVTDAAGVNCLCVQMYSSCLRQVYGALKAFHLVRERDSDTSKGYCFFEYLDPGVTDTAVKVRPSRRRLWHVNHVVSRVLWQGLNGIEIGSKTLTVRRAQARGDMPSSNMDMGIVAPLIPNLNAMADFQTRMSSPCDRFLLGLISLVVFTASTVICLLQAVVMDDLKDDQVSNAAAHTGLCVVVGTTTLLTCLGLAWSRRSTRRSARISSSSARSTEMCSAWSSHGPTRMDQKCRV